MTTAIEERPETLLDTQDDVLREAGEYLTFRLGKEEYGIGILQVQEIRSYEEPTRMAQAPDFVKGVIDLRGTIVPIIDLRIKLGCTQVEYTGVTVVIFLNLEGKTVGVVVDAVADVVRFGATQIMPAPHFEGQIDAALVCGIASVGERMLILIDMQRLLGASETKEINAVTA